MNGFRAEFFSELATLEENNFWFKARNQLIIWALNRYFANASQFFEIGCGTGFVLSGIQRAFPEMKLYGSELFAEGLAFARKRMSAATLFQMDARLIQFQQQFDCIGAFDVLEHIEEDTLVLQQMYKAIKPAGGLLLTVPQHRFLWSEQDVKACHVRRYTALELNKKVKQAGFTVIQTISFMSLLLPFMYVSRLMKRKHDDALAELKIPTLLNFSFEKILDLERSLIKLGLRLPFGGSLLLIAKK